MTAFDPVNRMQRSAKTAGGLGLRAVLSMFSIFILSSILGCASVETDSEEEKNFSIGDDTFPLFTNDVVIACDTAFPDVSNAATCISISNIIRAERIGKLVAYGLLIEEAGWVNFSPPPDEYISVDPMQVPSPVSIHFIRPVKSGCTAGIEFTPQPLSEANSTVLIISKPKLDCSK